jgi:hypothetical protein
MRPSTIVVRRRAELSLRGKSGADFSHRFEIFLYLLKLSSESLCLSVPRSDTCQSVEEPEMCPVSQILFEMPKGFTRRGWHYAYSWVLSSGRDERVNGDWSDFPTRLTGKRCDDNESLTPGAQLLMSPRLYLIVTDRLSLLVFSSAGSP